jgi:alpha-L-fucosidase
VRVEHPVTPVSAYATGWHSGEGPLNAIDGRSDLRSETCWSTWSSTPGRDALALPQAITVDLGGVWSNLTTLEYLPKQWNRNDTTDGDITAYTVFTSVDGVTFTQVAQGTWAGDQVTKVAEWPAVTAQFVRLRADAARGDYANVGGLIIGGRTARPALQSSFPPAGTRYRIINVHSGKALDIAGAGTANNPAVVQRTASAAATQQWTFERDVCGYYKIRNADNGTLLEIGGLSRADEAPAGTRADDNVPQQHWAVTPVGPGTHMLINRFSGLSLNVKGASQADGAAVTQYSYTGVAQEQWRLVPLGGSTVTPAASPTRNLTIAP